MKLRKESITFREQNFYGHVTRLWKVNKLPTVQLRRFVLKYIDLHNKNSSHSVGELWGKKKHMDL